MGFLDDYEPVEDRLRAFWEDHPTGRILTELVASTDGDYIFKASVWRSVGIHTFDFKGQNDPSRGEWIAAPETPPDATGYAHDSTAQLPNNMKASALEVCETSAIGRALANLGYAAKGKRPSREEMSKTPPSEVRAAPSTPSLGKSAAQGTVTPGGAAAVPTPSGAEAAQATTGDIRARADAPASASETVAASVDAAASGGALDTTDSGYGEGSGRSEENTPAPLQQMADGDQVATSDQWERLRAVCGDSMQKAVNRLNKVNGTAYTKATAVAGATRQEIANAITGEAA